VRKDTQGIEELIGYPVRSMFW